VLLEQRRERAPGQRVVVDDQDPLSHRASSGRSFLPTTLIVRQDTDPKDAYQAWLVGEVLLFGLLGASLALFLTHSSLPTSYHLPNLRLVLSTGITVAAALVAVLTGARFSADGRRSDLLLAIGFLIVSASNLGFLVGPLVAEAKPTSTNAWALVAGYTFAGICIAAAPFAEGREAARERTLGGWIVFIVCSLVVLWGLLYSVRDALPNLVTPTDRDIAPPALMAALSGQALLNLIAVLGFGWRYRNRREDLDRWLALAASLLLFSSLYLVFTPLLDAARVSQGDFLRVLGYAVLVMGVWRAIRSAEFGRAVADERARVAREIHDGLAQYLFAISTHATMLEHGASAEVLVPQIKEAATAAQQEARFAILALSSASGSAPFDAALRRYVEFLTADGALDVEIDIDPRTRLDPDEQIEVFRIVQEGLANARKHAEATRAEVRIGEHEGGRFVTIVDDGTGFDGKERPAGQGLRNIRARAASIGGEFRLQTAPGAGTSLEVALR
jgi:signal transduction histidine kinase